MFSLELADPKFRQNTSEYFQNQILPKKLVQGCLEDWCKYQNIQQSLGNIAEMFIYVYAFSKKKSKPFLKNRKQVDTSCFKKIAFVRKFSNAALGDPSSRLTSTAGRRGFWRVRRGRDEESARLGAASGTCRCNFKLRADFRKFTKRK